MIVHIPFDAAYGYDALAILVVKQRSGASDTILDSIQLMDEALSRQVGAAKHDHILISREYKRMLEVNQWLFTSFDWLHTEGLRAPAEQVKAHAIEQDRVNGVDRAAAKRALQERWFPGEALTEQKVGYGHWEKVNPAFVLGEEHEP